MAIFQVSNVSLAFGERVLLENVSFTLGERSRAALCGGNGEGKTTLMKIMAGQIKADGGSFSQTRGMRVSYLPQSDIVLKDHSVYEEIEGGFSRFQDKIRRQNEIEDILKERQDSALLTELSQIHEELLNSIYFRREAVISSVAKGLGFKESDLRRSCSEFSGGYQMRIALARVLCEEPDLMLLDEPTNYLDIEARMYLKSFIKSFNGSLLLVCHDRDFLDSTVTEVFELFQGKLSRYSGNYTFYEKQRRLEIEQMEAAARRQESEIEKTERFVERFRYKATKAKQVQSRIKALEKMESISYPVHLRTLHFSFPEPPHSPNDVIVIENLHKEYPGQVIYHDFSMTVRKGDKVAVTGHNGIGKSTLLKIMAGVDPSYSGICRLGPGIECGYYSQDTADSLDLSVSVFDQVSSLGTEGQIRNALGSFLFSGDDIYKKTSVLSGGERSRLSLLKILLKPTALLILDEPTNHLDMNSKDMLLKALQDYSGTIVFVSHDAYFIRGLADRILYLSQEGPQMIEGDYSYFEYRVSQENTDAPVSSPARKKEVRQAVTDRAEANRIKNRITSLTRQSEQLLDQSASLDKEISEIRSKMDLSENYSDPDKINALLTSLKDLESQKEETDNKWMEINEELEALQA
ncbi:MAG: ABC-F family ATP-binding cassette domain-containing protein [Sphaerochaetaceae bacterium]|nr:ABC-F family ATP-binding cassette domain-containing protein [Sphaerochaetaceae bacterium]